MSEGQVVALVMMFVIGLIGFLSTGLITSDFNCKHRKLYYFLGGLWTLFWCMPPLIYLFIKGVMG